jgi:hypothetical protein
MNRSISPSLFLSLIVCSTYYNCQNPPLFVRIARAWGGSPPVLSAGDHCRLNLPASIHQAEWSCSWSGRQTLRRNMPDSCAAPPARYKLASVSKAVTGAILQGSGGEVSRPGSSSPLDSLPGPIRKEVILLLEHRGGLFSNETALKNPQLYSLIRGSRSFPAAWQKIASRIPAIQESEYAYSDASILYAVGLVTGSSKQTWQDMFAAWRRSNSLEGLSFQNSQTAWKMTCGRRPGILYRPRQLKSRHPASGMVSDRRTLERLGRILAGLPESAMVNIKSNRAVFGKGLERLDACRQGRKGSQMKHCRQLLINWLLRPHRGYGRALDLYAPGFLFLSREVLTKTWEAIESGEDNRAWDILTGAMNSAAIAQLPRKSILAGHHGALDGYESLLLFSPQGREVFVWLSAGYGLAMESGSMPGMQPPADRIKWKMLLRQNPELGSIWQQ